MGCVKDDFSFRRFVPFMMFETDADLRVKGADTGNQINGLAMTGTDIYASSGSRVIKYHRGKEVGYP